MNEIVTTFTAMSADVPGESTYTLWSKVTEPLAQALGHVAAMGEGRERLTVTGGTADGRVIRYAWDSDPQSVMKPERCHDMVMIVRDLPADDESDQCEGCGWERRHCICH